MQSTGRVRVRPKAGWHTSFAPVSPVILSNELDCSRLRGWVRDGRGDAIPPDTLVGLVEDAIRGLVDEHAWAVEQAYEESERAILEQIVSAA
jgi:hypothetical protein